MHPRSLGLLACVPLLLCWGCAVPPPQPYLALRTTADEMRRVTTICIDPVAIEFPVTHREQRIATIETSFRAALAHKGYRSPEIEDTRRAAQAVADEGTGFFDPDTGFLDAEGFRRYRAYRIRGLQRHLGCGAVLVATVVPVYAPFELGRAEWDGVQQFMVAKREEAGWLRALSVYVHLFDVTGRELYFSTGGIEVLATISGAFLRKGRPVEAGAILGDEWRIRNGVWTSLADLPSREEPIQIDSPPSDARPRGADL